MTKQDEYKEWEQLLLEAKALGFTIDDIKEFLQYIRSDGGELYVREKAM